MNDRAGIRTLLHLYLWQKRGGRGGGQENIPFLEKDCYNYLDEFGGCDLEMGMLWPFKAISQECKLITYLLDFDNQDRLGNMFWADARSRGCI